MNRAPWTESEGIRLESRSPFVFQGELHEALHHPIFQGRDAQRPHLAVGFWDEYPAHRRGDVVLQAQTILHQLAPVLVGVTYDSVDSRSLPTAVFLTDRADGQEFRGTGRDK